MTNLIFPVISSTVVCCRALNHILQNGDVCVLIVVYNYEAADVASGRVPALVVSLHSMFTVCLLPSQPSAELLEINTLTSSVNFTTHLYQHAW